MRDCLQDCEDKERANNKTEIDFKPRLGCELALSGSNVTANPIRKETLILYFCIDSYKTVVLTCVWFVCSHWPQNLL